MRQLAATEVEKDVGVKVTSNLKPGSQCTAAARTANTVLPQLCRSFHYRDRHVFIKLYKTYVRPHLEFATPAWSPWTTEDKDCLEDVQRRAIRMVSGLRATTYEAKLEELGVFSLEERRHQADMQQVYKILHGFDKCNQLFRMAADSERTTRASADPWNVKVPFARLESRKHFFTVKTTSLWNEIPREIKEAKNQLQFKLKYKEYRRKALCGAHE